VSAGGIARPVPAAFPWAEAFSTVGVTGTNGKTSTSHFIAAILHAASKNVVCQSTLGYFFDGEEAPIERSERGFFEALARANDGGCRHAVVEVTSKALSQGYARKWRFDHGVFTNLTRDHVAEHGSWEHYLASKAQLFVHLGPGRTAVLNARDEGALLIDRVTPPDVRRVWYGAPSRGPELRASDLTAAVVTPTLRGTSVELAPSPLAERLGGKLELGLIGDVYAENALAAAALALALGVDGGAIHAGLAACRQLPGRFDVVSESPCVVLDFAHTPDALARVCDTARRLAGAGRVLVVFGAAGGFDGPKREAMGEAVGARADLAFVTNENPRHEDPLAIIEAVAAGCRAASHAATRVIADRRDAIRAAIAEARPGDLVLITGRGREEGLVEGSVVLPYSDQAAVREALRGS
jgi:UDP-N-acetylmuramoyl-L-alanyl-D-glutamate--2,6-diaminopimelate ligase